MSDDITVTLTYTEEEAREVARAFLYFTSNVSATREDQDRMTLIRSAIKGALPRPKPEEPTGLGAVVEDANGECWVRAARIKHGWHRPMGTWAAFEDIAAVRVLSEGVTS